ncbi:MAG: tryptophan synthase subunit alpha [Planctomycetia bacterium]|nr:tryptophan synthase subunit alpha [Planctomycetia bacterium]
MSAIDDVFRELRAGGRKAFMPFVTAGDPDLEFTALVLVELARRGANLCELGIPYSDPIADGPVIQASYTRALARRVKLAQIFEMVGRERARLPIPIVTMVSYAIALRHGPADYVREAKAAGIAGMIVPDLPADESEQLAGICRGEDFSLVQLVAPTTPRERALRIARTSSGFLYYVSVTGITGERAALPQDLLDNVRWLREQTELPICVGFGISRPEHVRALAPVADGLIVGSAIVRRVAEAATRPRGQVLREVGDYVAELVGALG